jgi:hypothetical protein
MRDNCQIKRRAPEAKKCKRSVRRRAVAPLYGSRTMRHPVTLCYVRPSELDCPASSLRFAHDSRIVSSHRRSGFHGAARGEPALGVEGRYRVGVVPARRSRSRDFESPIPVPGLPSPVVVRCLAGGGVMGGRGQSATRRRSRTNGGETSKCCSRPSLDQAKRLFYIDRQRDQRGVQGGNLWIGHLTVCRK